MLKKIYAHNYRCLENFTLDIGDRSSTLLIGKNGVGKSSIRDILLLFQSIAQNVNRVKDLVSELDSAWGRTELPMRFRLDVELYASLYSYEIAFELPERFQEYRVLEERLAVDDRIVFHRTHASVSLAGGLKRDPDSSSRFSIDWHLVALPIIHVASEQDPVAILRTWLSRMIVLAPIPQTMTGFSTGESLQPMSDGANIADWFNGVVGPRPAMYGVLSDSLRNLFPDFLDVINEAVGVEAKRLSMRFNDSGKTLTVQFQRLSDGERCRFLLALIAAADAAYGPLFCFWDEPDNYLSLSDIAQLMLALRKTFDKGGQLIVTSHHPETIGMFPRDAMLLLDRRSHLEPTQCDPVNTLRIGGDLINAIITGDANGVDQ